MDDLWIHDETDRNKANILVRFFEDNATDADARPRPFGIFYQEERGTYEESLSQQLQQEIEVKGAPDLNKLLAGGNTWEK
jgi:2-oxoglutarate ferredoxin oxidoreductase subunit beta